MNHKRIILCLDIDQTIINSNAPDNLVDINGSDYYDDATPWVNFLTEIKTLCAQQAFQFFVQIITAKDRVDIHTERVFNALHPFLLPLNQHGEVVHTERAIQFVEPTEGYVPTQFHYTNHQAERQHRLASTTRLDFNEKIESGLLAPIHICGLTSKAEAMKYIAEYFHDITPAKNVFLLDDQMWNIEDVQQPAYGYQGVLANKLRELEHDTKEARTLACHELFTTLKNKIEARIQAIMVHMHKTRGPSPIPIIAAQPEHQKPHAIHRAAKLGQLRLVKKLLEDEPLLVHTIDAFNQTPLVWAAAKGHHDIVKLLIDHGADINQTTHLPSTTQSQQTNYFSTPLDWAIQGRHIATVEVLFVAGAVSHHHHDIEILNDLIRAHNQTHVQALILKNQDHLNQRDIEGYTALHVAVIHNQIDVFRDLIAMGADINTRTAEASGQHLYIDYPHQTAVEIACELDDEWMVSILFEAGASIKPSEEYKQQPIHLFAKHGLLTQVQTLIMRYPEMVHATDSMNQTPLLWAATHGHHDIVTLLIQYGAHVNQPTLLPNDHEAYATEHNKTPLDWAVSGHHIKTIVLLLQAGGVVHHAHDGFDVRSMINQLMAHSIFQAPSVSSSADDVAYEGDQPKL
ncbi:MAG: ankyrin repeat domain-containing protein [Legionellaceae bacterium]|nr:ankyrin repeat domain-containing protein [Legionellaceae bacterium]